MTQGRGGRCLRAGPVSPAGGVRGSGRCRPAQLEDARPEARRGTWRQGGRRDRGSGGRWPAADGGTSAGAGRRPAGTEAPPRRSRPAPGPVRPGCSGCGTRRSGRRRRVRCPGPAGSSAPPRRSRPWTSAIWPSSWIRAARLAPRSGSQASVSLISAASRLEFPQACSCEHTASVSAQACSVSPGLEQMVAGLQQIVQVRAVALGPGGGPPLPVLGGAPVRGGQVVRPVGPPPGRDGVRSRPAGRRRPYQVRGLAAPQAPDRDGRDPTPRT